MISPAESPGLEISFEDVFICPAVPLVVNASKLVFVPAASHASSSANPFIVTAHSTSPLVAESA